MSVANFSWVIPERLAGSAVPDFSGKAGVPDADWLVDEGVDVLVSLAMPYGEAAEECDRVGIDWIFYPIPDFDIPSDQESFSALVEDLVEAVRDEEGIGVCVHCQAGIGRTGLLLACIMGKYLGISGDKAVAAVRKTRPGSLETPGQVNFVKQFLSGKPE
ncbi:MAG: dual specificity protein phosphatase family protein [Chitinispirillia bacterium]|nr:dual specificity protein phosphatase family protein [Chitinispirillia bacterium]MCL2241045.1 dual specificity protein phosphatase family protein [Chitinispirillia bacterium]